MLSVDALLFDLDGTLIDSQRDIANAVHELQRRYDREPSPDAEVARFIGDGVAALVERAIGERPAPELAEAVAFFKAHYRAHALDHTYVYPGVYDTLAALSDKKLAVVTNKPVRISRHILTRLGLIRFFPVVIGGDSVQKKKPHPEGLLAALEQLGMRRPERALMVGDSAQDVLAARAAGMRSCGIESNIGDPALMRRARPDITVPSMPDLMRVIQ